MNFAGVLALRSRSLPPFELPTPGAGPARRQGLVRSTAASHLAGWQNEPSELILLDASELGRSARRDTGDQGWPGGAAAAWSACWYLPGLAPGASQASSHRPDHIRLQIVRPPSGSAGRRNSSTPPARHRRQADGLNQAQPPEYPAAPFDRLKKGAGVEQKLAPSRNSEFRPMPISGRPCLNDWKNPFKAITETSRHRQSRTQSGDHRPDRRGNAMAGCTRRWVSSDGAAGSAGRPMGAVNSSAASPGKKPIFAQITQDRAMAPGGRIGPRSEASPPCPRASLKNSWRRGFGALSL